MELFLFGGFYVSACQCEHIYADPLLWSLLGNGLVESGMVGHVTVATVAAGSVAIHGNAGFIGADQITWTRARLLLPPRTIGA